MTQTCETADIQPESMPCDEREDSEQSRNGPAYDDRWWDEGCRQLPLFFLSEKISIILFFKNIFKLNFNLDIKYKTCLLRHQSAQGSSRKLKSITFFYLIKN